MHDMDEFDKKYSMYTEKPSENFDLGTGMFETFGVDLEIVMNMVKKYPRRVWTAIDTDEGELAYINGWHYVNRIYYLITNEDGKEDEEYILIKNS